MPDSGKILLMMGGGRQLLNLQNLLVIADARKDDADKLNLTISAQPS